MATSAAVDGFRLAYDRHGAGRGAGAGPAVVLLHGWPGDRTDWRDVVAALPADLDVVVPDLRGFGGSDKHPRDPAEAYDASAQARSVAGLVEELGLDRPVLGGYDVGSRVAQTLAASRPDLVRSLVIAPPLPGVGRRILDPEAQPEFWYQSFHQLALAEDLVDGRHDAVRAYLRHFWTHWSGPAYTPSDDDLDRLTLGYAAPGAFVASIGWYRAGGGVVARSLAETAPRPEDRVTVPAHVLWPEHDPLFPRAWSDRVGEWYADVTVEPVDGVGHFVPREAPDRFAAALVDAVASGDR